MNSKEHDWNALWKDQFYKNMQCRGTNDCAMMWETEEKAYSFLQQSRENPHRIQHIIDGLPLSRESRVLDIGAGPGTLAVPLSKIVSFVTAVEPAAGMTKVLREYAGEEQVSNLSIVQKRWEEIDVSTDLFGKYDIVVASYSLGMPDIRSAIQSICEASSRWVYLYWFAGITSWEQMMIDIWPQLHGQEYCTGPKCDILYNLLYSMGIYPNVETTPMDHIRTFTDLDAAVAEYRDQYRIETPGQEEVLKDYLKKTLKNNGNSLSLSGITKRVKIWWEVN